LEEWYRQRLLPRFHDCLLSVDQAVAETAAEISALRMISPHDALIAATARVHGLTLATRNVSDFADTGISIVNPWILA
jgi:predicted nucleic acid-binding protein